MKALFNGRFKFGLAAACVIALASPANAQNVVSIVGITEPFLDVTLSAPVAGTVQKITVRDGDTVTKGQRVVELAKRAEELEVNRRKLLWEGKAELDAATASAELLKKDLDATRKLSQTTTSISTEQVEQKELEHRQAVAEVDRLKLVEAREEIEYEQALETLRLLEIDAPIAGTVAERYLEVGEDCRAQQPLMRIVDTSRVYFVSNIEARFGYRLKVGQMVALSIEAGDQPIKVSGEISFISPVVDPSSGLLKIKALFDNANGVVRPGVAGMVQISGN